MNICDYGCGKEAKYLFKSGRWCCSKSHNSCEVMKRKNSELIKGKIVSKETCQKISKANQGRIPWNKNKKGFIKHTDETKKIISNLHKGKKLSIKQKEKIGKSNKGKKHSDRTKELMSKNHCNFYGEKNPNWRGGIQYELYCEQWLDQEYKESIKDRDGYKCLNPICNKTSDRLCVHHINYIKKDCHPLNLITICNSCNVIANSHRKWHELWYKTILFRRGVINVKYI